MYKHESPLLLWLLAASKMGEIYTRAWRKKFFVKNTAVFLNEIPRPWSVSSIRIYLKQYRKVWLAEYKFPRILSAQEYTRFSVHSRYGQLPPQSYTAGEEGYVIRSLNMLYLQMDYQLKSFIKLKTPSLLLLCIDILCRGLLETLRRFLTHAHMHYFSLYCMAHLVLI